MHTYPNWFLPLAEPNFRHYVSKYAAQPVRFLQIGAFTGDASLWLLENVLTHPKSELVDIDTWEGSDEDSHRYFDWADVEKTYDSKVQPYHNVTKVKATSDEFFASAEKDNRFDFIYIDGAHSALQVLRDAINGFDHLKVGGILIFDDYFWKSGRGSFYDPQPAVDSFRKIYAQYIETMDMNYQVWIRKIADIEQ